MDKETHLRVAYEVVSRVLGDLQSSMDMSDVIDSPCLAHAQPMHSSCKVHAQPERFTQATHVIRDEEREGCEAQHVHCRGSSKQH